MSPLRSPLPRFALLGAALYALQRLALPAAPSSPEPIVIEAAALRSAVRAWSGTTGRPPLPSELELLVRDRVDDELLFREALARDLHRTDAIAVRRLIRNQEFLSTGLEDAPPDDELLARALDLGFEKTDLVVRRRLVQRVRDEIVQEARADSEPIRAATTRVEVLQIRPSHVFLSRAAHGAALQDDARTLRARIVAAGWRPDDPEVRDLGDPLLVARDLPLLTERRLAARLGPALAAEAFRLPIGSWSQPIAGSYGMHIVWVHERATVTQAAIGADVSSQAASDRASLRAVLDDLRRGVPIVVPPTRTWLAGPSSG